MIMTLSKHIWTQPIDNIEEINDHSSEIPYLELVNNNNERRVIGFLSDLARQEFLESICDRQTDEQSDSD